MDETEFIFIYISKLEINLKNVLKAISSVRPGIITDALKELWKIRPELYKMVVIGAYLDERISLTKAAENLGITRMEFEKDLRESGTRLQKLMNGKQNGEHWLKRSDMLGKARKTLKKLYRR